MASTSHMRCKNCGAQTHRRTAQADLCWKCWRVQGVPLLKAERQRIKLSRRKRRQAERLAELHPVQAGLVETARAAAEEPEPVLPTMTELGPPLPGYVSYARELVEQRNAALEAEQLTEAAAEAGQLPDEPVELPKPDKTGTPEWAAWVRQFIGKPRLTDEQETEVVRLLQDPEIPQEEIAQAYGIGGATLTRLKRKHNIPPRDRSLATRLGRERSKNGRLERVDGEMQWVPQEQPQLALPQQEVEEDDVRIHVQRKPKRGILMSGQGVLGNVAVQPGGTQAWLTGAKDAWQEEEEKPVATEPEQSEPEKNGRRTSLTPEQQQDIIERYKGGATVMQISRDVAVSDSVIYRMFQAHGVKMRHSSGRVYPKAPLATVDTPVSMAPAVVMERGWIVAYTVSSQRMLNAPTIEEALRRIKEELGGQVEIRSINPV